MKIQNVKSLPEVLTIGQSHQIIDCCTTQRIVFFWTVYSLGMRIVQGSFFQILRISATEENRTKLSSAKSSVFAV